LMQRQIVVGHAAPLLYRGKRVMITMPHDRLPQNTC
jgi:hypothetical protein